MRSLCCSQSMSSQVLISPSIVLGRQDACVQKMAPFLYLATKAWRFLKWPCHSESAHKTPRNIFNQTIKLKHQHLQHSQQ